MTESIPFPQLLAELQAAHKASLGNNPKAIAVWSVLIDKHASRVFEELARLQMALDGATSLVLKTDQEVVRLTAEKAEAEARFEKVMSGQAAKDRAHNEALEGMRQRLLAFEKKLEEKIAQHLAEETLIEEQLTKFQLINRDLANRLKTLNPRATLKEGPIDEVPLPNGHHEPRPSLIVPAVMEQLEREMKLFGR